MQTSVGIEVDPMSPKGQMLIDIAIEYVRGLYSGQRLIPVTFIRHKLKKGKCLLIEREIVAFAKELGFKVVYPKNKAHIRVESEQQLRDITEGAGFSEGFYDEIEGLLTNTNLH
jgi:hypothetical protein